MKICIANTMVEFGISEKNFNENVNTPYKFIPPDLATPTKSQNTSSSTYMDTNNLYKWLKQTKTTIVQIIRTLKQKRGSLESYL